MVRRTVKWSDKIGPADFEKISRRGLTRAGAVVSGQAIALCPVQTNRLRGSITYAVESEQSQISSPARTEDKIGKPTDKYVCHVGSNVEYAQHIEYGTVHFPTGKPFLRPAFDMSRKNVNQIFRDEIRNHFSG